MFLVYFLLLFSYQYQCKWLPGKTHLGNDPLCVEQDVKLYSLTHSHSVSVIIYLIAVCILSFPYKVCMSQYSTLVCKGVAGLWKSNRRQRRNWAADLWLRSPTVDAAGLPSRLNACLSHSEQWTSRCLGWSGRTSSSKHCHWTGSSDGTVSLIFSVITTLSAPGGKQLMSDWSHYNRS